LCASYSKKNDAFCGIVFLWQKFNKKRQILLFFAVFLSNFANFCQIFIFVITQKSQSLWKNFLGTIMWILNYAQKIDFI